MKPVAHFLYLLRSRYGIFKHPPPPRKKKSSNHPSSSEHNLNYQPNLKNRETNLNLTFTRIIIIIIRHKT